MAAAWPWRGACARGEERAPADRCVRFALALAPGLPFLLLAPPSLAAPAPPSWRALADCAAAYQANARIADPSRPASMTSMISDQAGDYAKAAAKARAGPGAKTAVDRYVASRAPTFGRMSRADLDRFIEACPQLEPPG